ncbi:MAG TPA: thioredoxin fold domain-containing protein [Gammaproteobacteria bacterium]
MRFKIINSLFISYLLLAFSTLAFAREEGVLEAGMVNPGAHEQPDWFKNSFLDINEDIAEAKARGKRLMLYFYQDGCPYCKKLFEDNFGQRSIADKTRNNFDVVTINIWGDREVNMGESMSEKAFAEKLKVMYTPTLIFFNEDGEAILRANGYYHPGKFNAALDYVLERHDRKETFPEYLARVTPKPASGVIHRDVETAGAPYQFDRASNSGKKYRLMMFEQKQCQACDELHQDILKRDESRKLLKNFDVSILDIWSDDKIVNKDGKTVKVRDFAKQMNIQYAPSLVFTDQKGQEVFRTDGYLKSFHIQSVMEYVATDAYREQPNFQRYIEARADKLRAMGIEVDIMN